MGSSARGGDESPSMEDYTLTIEEVSRRLNKSTRTIHRYKDNGRLSHRAGTTQGNPLLFSRAEVEALERELLPRPTSPIPWADPDFFERISRMEQVLAVLDRNPLLMQVAGLVNDADFDADDEVVEALHHLTLLKGKGAALKRQELGDALLRLGRALNVEGSH